MNATTTQHNWTQLSDACTCGADTCLCQMCATVVCGTLAKWFTPVPGKTHNGNVCWRCAAGHAKPLSGAELQQQLNRVNHIYPPGSPFWDSATGQEWLKGDVTAEDIDKVVRWAESQQADDNE